MANTKISDLPAAGSVAAANEFAINEAGTSKKVTALQIKTYATVTPDYPRVLRPTDPKYVLPGWFICAVVGRAIDSGCIYYIPIFVTETLTYTVVRIYVTAAAAGVVDFRIFNWSNGLPGSQVGDGGNVDVSTTGAKGVALTFNLTRGYYFLAYRANVAGVSLYGPDISYAVAPPVSGSTPSFNGPEVANVISSVVAAYDDPAPTPNLYNDAQFACAFLYGY